MFTELWASLSAFWYVLTRLHVLFKLDQSGKFPGLWGGWPMMRQIYWTKRRNLLAPDMTGKQIPEG